MCIYSVNSFKVKIYLLSMDKTFLRMQVRVITQPDEPTQPFEDSFSFLYTDKKEPFTLEVDSFLNITEQKQHIITAVFQKARHIRYAVDTLFTQLSEAQIKELLEQVDSRLDDECHFFIRFEKEAFLKKEFILTQSGDCIHIMLSVAAYPSRKEIAQPLVENYLNSKLNK